MSLVCVRETYEIVKTRHANRLAREIYGVVMPVHGSDEKCHSHQLCNAIANGELDTVCTCKDTTCHALFNFVV